MIGTIYLFKSEDTCFKGLAIGFDSSNALPLKTPFNKFRTIEVQNFYMVRAPFRQRCECAVRLFLIML